MAGNFIYKPETSKGPVFLHSGGAMTPPTITLASGQVVTARYLNTVDEGGGPNSQYVFPSSVLNQKGATLSFGGQKQTLDNSNLSYRGDSIGSLQESSKGAIGSSPGIGSGPGGAGFPSQFNPSNIGAGSIPAYLASLYPSAQLINYNPIQAAPFKYTDPFKFAQKFGNFSRDEISKNSKLASDLSLEQIDTELKGLQQFAPGANALKQNLISSDNTFNQGQRTSQVNAALPGVSSDLAGQEARANSYANGQVPDSVTNSALELSLRSRAADQSTAAGFGASSRAGQRISDLLDAQTRIGLSQYGDQLLSSNANQRASLFLAPTEYSNAGAQINVTPSVSGSQLASSNLSQIDSLSNLSAGQALSTEVGQQQFTTGLEQQTRQFNATNQLGADEFDANTSNQFAQDKFAYQVGFAGTVAGAQQTDTNAQIEQQQQQQAQQIAQQSGSNVAAGQNAAAGGAIAGAVGGALVGAAGANGAPGSPGQGGAGGAGGTGGTGGGGGASGGSGASGAGGIDGQGSGDISGGTPIEEAPGRGSSNDGDFGTPTSEPPAADNGSQDDTGSDTGSDGSFGDSGDTFDTGGVGDEAFTAKNGNVASFVSALGASVPSPAAQDSMINHSSATLANAGVYSRSGTGTQPIGVDNSGDALHANSAMLNSPNQGAGNQSVTGVQNAIAPLGVLDSADSAALNKVAATSSDSQLHQDLTTAQSNNDTSSFISTLAKGLGVPLNATTTKTALNGAYTAYNLSQNWSKMSPAQRSLGIASLGLQGFKFKDGQTLASKEVIPAQGNIPSLKLGTALALASKGVNVYSLAKNWVQTNNIQHIAGGQTSPQKAAVLAIQTNMLGHGTTGSAVPTNVTKLQSQGWTPAPHYGVGAVTGSPGSVVPQGYVSVGKGIAVPRANASTAQAAIPQAGSTAGTPATEPPRAYKNWVPPTSNEPENGVNGGSQMVAALNQMSNNNPHLFSGVAAQSFSQNAVKSAPASRGTNSAGNRPTTDTSGAATTAHTVTNDAGAVNNVVKNPTAGRIIAGVNTGLQVNDTFHNGNLTPKQRGTLAQQQVGTYFANRYTWGQAGKLIGDGRNRYGGTAEKVDALDAHTNPVTMELANTISGKSGPQQGRDGMRRFAQSTGLADTNFDVTLADGSKANIGIDGHGGQRTVTNPDLLTKDQAGTTKLNAWDTDYTNDLDYASGMAGITLSRLMTGSSGTSQDQFGSQLGNAALANVGYGKDFSQGNFQKTMDNFKSMFAQQGIKSKADAYQLINQGYAEHRFNDTEMASMQQAANMVFDPNGYGNAQKLMSGRQRGVETATSQKNTPNPVQPNIPVADSVSGVSNTPVPTTQNGFTPSKFKAVPITVNGPEVPKLLDKASAAQRNAARYSSGALNA